MGLTEALERKLMEDSFNVQRKAAIGRYVVDLFGMSPILDVPPNYPAAAFGRAFDLALGNEPYVIICSIVMMDNPSKDSITDYSRLVYNYSIERTSSTEWKDHLSRIVISIVDASTLSDDAKLFVKGFETGHFKFPVWNIEQPVLAEIVSGDVYYNPRVTFKGYRLKKAAVNAVKKYVSSEQ